MQELRLVAVSEDGTYLVLATAGRGTRFTLPVDDRLRAAVRGNFSRLGQFEIEVESPLRPKEIQARIRAGETAEEIAATAGIPVERVRWFEGPVLQEREYIAQQAQRVAVRLPGESAARPTLGELVAERLTRRGVPVDEIDWDSCKRDDNLWRIKLGYVWNGHTRHAEWLFDPRRRHVSPYDDEAMRLSADDYADPQAEEATVRPFVPRIAGKLAPVPPPEFDYDVAEPAPLRVAPNGNLPDHFSPRFSPEPSLPAAFHEPAEPPRPPNYGPPEPQVSAPPSQPTHYYTAPEPPPAAPPAKDTRLATAEPQAAEPPVSAPVTPEPQAAAQETPSAPEPQAGPAAPAEPVRAPATPEPQAAAPATPEPQAAAPATAEPQAVAPARPETQVSAPVAEPRPSAPEEATATPAAQEVRPAEAPAAPATPEAASAQATPEASAAQEAAPEPKAAEPVVREAQPVAPEPRSTPAAPAAEARPAEPAAPVVDRAVEEATAFVAPEAPAVVPAQPTPAPVPAPAPAPEPVAEEPVEEPPTPAVMPKTVAPRPGPPRAKPPAQRPAPKEDKPSEPVPAGAAPAPAPKPAPRRKSRARRASVPSWDEIMFGAPKQD
ncbi:septation protein SepH [Herbidospora cretacea]|uniref:septation protein SepH n=1 Tax=Herbidospora cretacea TaxID=28444 RepID=UPI0007731DB5|nr:septation protein SepH [Herbidospora cretacea]